MTLNIHRMQWNTKQPTRRTNIHFPIKILLVATSSQTNLIYWLSAFPCGWQKRSEWDCFDKQPPELDTKYWHKRIYLVCAIQEVIGFLKKMNLSYIWLNIAERYKL